MGAGAAAPPDPPAAIKSHVSAVLTQFGFRNRVQAAIIVYKPGLVKNTDRDQ
ncbi:MULTISPECIES: hypothetical protein [Streptomyces]|uniref:hypothetical protein n=1 Tax=Streptomyces TaxID=1883 RepID=UPI0024AFAB99|nr:hypothetical protein [Streptomyces sp. BPPL-273]WHM32462.1 hypothetical protein OH540_21410 [Streptomyces sp. BPPL-273]